MSRVFGVAGRRFGREIGVPTVNKIYRYLSWLTSILAISGIEFTTLTKSRHCSKSGYEPGVGTEHYSRQEPLGTRGPIDEPAGRTDRMRRPTDGSRAPMRADRATPVDASLVLRTQLGDREAADDLLGQMAPRLGAYLRSIIRNDEDACDLLQDVLVIVYRKIRWLSDPAYLFAWAYRIAAREAFRHIRRRKGAGQVLLTEEEWKAVRSRERPLSAFEGVLERQAVQGIEELPPAGRAVLCLHYLEGLSIEEAAEHLGIAPGTAKSRLAFALRKLRERLAPAAGPGKAGK